MDTLTTNKPAILIGIDPGAFTGFAALDEKGWTLKTMDFFAVLDYVRLRHEYEMLVKSRAVFIIETAKSLPIYAKRSKATLGAMLSTARDIGGNNRESELMIHGIRRLGFEVIEYVPSNDSPKWDAKTCAQITGYTGKTNEHVRDAMRFVWAYRHLLRAKV